MVQMTGFLNEMLSKTVNLKVVNMFDSKTDFISKKKKLLFNLHYFKTSKTADLRKNLVPKLPLGISPVI